MASYRQIRSSMFVAPLQINKRTDASTISETGSTGSEGQTEEVQDQSDARQATSAIAPHEIAQDDTEMPDTSEATQPEVVFHNYLRAFYPFRPTGDLCPETVTLSLEQGDVVMIHSVHANGWADGTLLETGARGWLPTNYCEPYEQEQLLHLLKALTAFWETIRGGSNSSIEMFRNQDYMHGLIAGVRLVLVSENT